jgi:hypothetical protein
MRSNAVGAMAWLAVACGGGDSGATTPYSNARSEMCGAQPTGIWQVIVTSDPRPLDGQTDPVCKTASAFAWDFSVAKYTNTYDQGCALQCTEVFNDGAEVNDLEVMWVASDKWTGTVKVDGVDNRRSCEAIVDVTLTR